MSESIMRAGPIDQSRSEAHLHRALWLIKFLRAMVLHVLFVLIAAVLFFGFGIHQASPSEYATEIQDNGIMLRC
jgi:hypothetical protein